MLQCGQTVRESGAHFLQGARKLHLTHLVPLTLFEPTAANQLSNDTTPSVPSSSTSARDCASISATDSDCRIGVTHAKRNECLAQQSSYLQCLPYLASPAA